MRTDVIATTKERFTDFAPYVASVNSAGTVAFQAALADGHTGVFAGSGGSVTDVVLPGGVGVKSHPDINDAGATCFYGELADGEAVFLHRDGDLQAIVNTPELASIGPLGPTMNEAGTVAFRADGKPGTSGIFAADGAAVTRIADTDGPWARFEGLPVVDEDGAIVFRADRKDGRQGIYAGRRGSIETVAETGDYFESLGRFPSVFEGTVAFAATLRAGGAGIFAARDGEATRVIAEGAYETYRGALLAGAGVVVAIATPRGGGLGLFAGSDPEADRIVAVGDSLFGSTVTELASNPVSVSAAGHVAIRVKLADATQLIVRAGPVG